MEKLFRPMPISPEQMFPLLLKADPSFTPTWQAFVKEWQHERDGLPLTIAIDEFGRHLAAKLEAGEVSRFGEVFATIEMLHFSTDAYVSNEVKGICEALLDTSLYGRLHPYDFEAWLLPETKRSWLAINKGYYGREWPANR